MEARGGERKNDEFYAKFLNFLCYNFYICWNFEV